MAGPSPAGAFYVTVDMTRAPSPPSTESPQHNATMYPKLAALLAMDASGTGFGATDTQLRAHRLHEERLSVRENMLLSSLSRPSSSTALDLKCQIAERILTQREKNRSERETILADLIKLEDNIVTSGPAAATVGSTEDGNPSENENGDSDDNVPVVRLELMLYAQTSPPENTQVSQKGTFVLGSVPADSPPGTLPPKQANNLPVPPDCVVCLGNFLPNQVIIRLECMCEYHYGCIVP